MSAFNPNQPTNTSITIMTNYIALNISNMTLNSTTNYVTGSCQPTSSSNITYTNASSTNEYKADTMWIIGDAPGSSNPLHDVLGAQNVIGEIVIRNVSTNNDNYIYMCYLLSPSTNTGSTSQVDTIMNSVYSNSGSVPININLNADTSETLSSAKYIVYTSSSLNPGVTVCVYSIPIPVSSSSSSYLLTLQNNLDLFDMSASVYSVVGTNTEGSWMECDYVPIDSEEIMTYNLPINSGVAKDQSTFNSFQTIILFVVFFFISVFAYFLIPSVYSWLAMNLLSKINDQDEIQKKNRIFMMDCIVSGLLVGVSVILIATGAFGPESPNNGDVLLSGFCISIIYIIGYIIIQSKKNNDPKFIDGIDYTYVK